MTDQRLKTKSASNPRRSNGYRRNALKARVRSREGNCWICGGAIDWGLPNLDPCQGVLDEIVPVKYGGSPTDSNNISAAHRCCNNWRKTKPVTIVKQVQSIIQTAGGASDPLTWCTKARAVLKNLQRQGGSGGTVQPHTTTNW